MGRWDRDDLDELRWHWGDAYRIDQDGGSWRAIRRDTGAALRGATSDELLALIRRDYFLDPVSRTG
jgi:hypothetical protein